MPKLLNRIVQYIRNCETCLKATPVVHHAPLRPLVSKRFLHIIQADFFGPLDPDPVTGHRFYCFFVYVTLFLTNFFLDMLLLLQTILVAFLGAALVLTKQPTIYSLFYTIFV